MSAMGSLAPTVTRQVIERYVMFGLACVFGCVSLAVTLAWCGTLLEWAALMAFVPLLVLLVGAVVLRHTVRLTRAIEEQLRAVAVDSANLTATLHPLPNSEPLAIGWNRILTQLREENVLSTLEERLRDTLNTSEFRRWETIFRSLPDGVAVCDAQDRVVLANPVFTSMFGRDASCSAAGRTMAELFGTFPESPSIAQLQATIQNCAAFNAEFRKGNDLAAGVLRVCRTPVLGDAFGPGSCLWALRDVTQQKLAEEMRNQFVFAATHELRTPLANIKAYAETLAASDDIDFEQQKRFFNIINAEATRLARFIDELLNVSQMEAGAMTISRHEADIERLVNEVIDHIQPQIQQKHLQFERELPAKFPKLRMDKDKIVAALVNLLGNAAKYTPDGGQVRMIVEVDANLIHFHVEDTGIGISADELPRLCEKFFRSKDSRVRKVTGSGLGLAFSQEVARLHGGKITVRSELNKGSRFTLSLPLD